jgi:hypothetical protein
MANKYMKKCSISLVINQNDTDIPPHSSQNDCHKRKQTTNVGEDVRGKEALCTVGGNAN